MAEEMRKARKGKIALILCNILLVVIGVVFVMRYSANVAATQVQMAHESFCNTVDTMKQISERYLEIERSSVEDWAAYIEQQHMTMDEALEYIRESTTQGDRIAHFVDMDTFEARSSLLRSDGDSVGIYQKYYSIDGAPEKRYINRMRQMFNNEWAVLGCYKVYESQINVISVGTSVTLRVEDGDRDYLLLRVIPVESMKKLWLFPMDYATAQIGLINPQGDYVIPAYSMRSQNFLEFIRYYNYPDDYNGAQEMLDRLQAEEKGMLEYYDSKGQMCYWYFSRLDTFDDLDIIGYIPAAELDAHPGDNMSIVFFVGGVMLLILLIDGVYILGINRRLRAAAKIAQQANDAKTQFLSSMSHDIRTPLNAVLGMTELAQTHLGNTDYVRECLRKISVSGNHLLTLINDILEISRVESGKIQVNPAPFEVTELTASLVSITRSQTIGRGLEFDVQQHDIPHDCLMGDKLRLSQVYLNLLNNAVKYTNPGGKVRLEMREERITDESVTLVCVVEDTGMGMSEEFQKTMYDSFTRAADSRIDKTQGTGLGLAIVKRMVMLMNGTIDCKSVEGVGTTFTVRIPLDIAQMPKTQQQSDDGTQGADLAGLHVMIAEDNDINWEIIETLLDSCGIYCERAETGRECVDKLMAAPPDTYDLVLMDVQMPVLNGRDATRELRACNRPDLRQIPVAAMTADAFAEDVQACMDAGMDAHISKPIELDKVLMTMRKLLTRKASGDLHGN